ncbi:MAG TPA: RHS repeat-associated core domain-containing protein, partial [Noviherbaspirillum sp.]|nr:RHS repeat-associated core domain-containing protein [Noviherbaspirillum sp.]
RVSYPAPDDSGSTVTEYSVHTASGGARSRKVVETRNADGVLTQLKTVTYLGDVDATASYTQADDSGIVYDGENVSNAVLQTDYRELRIRLGHAQQLRILSGVLEAGGQQTTTTWYSLGDQIDSCQTELGENGCIDSYQSFYPYGGTAFVASGDTSADSSLSRKVRQYSGEQKDDSGLSYYGFRSYDASAFCWISPDPAGYKGSGLNWYRMVGGNPVTYRDKHGLVRELTVDVGLITDNPVLQLFNLEELISEWSRLPAPAQILVGENHMYRDASLALVNSFYSIGFCSRKSYYGIEGVVSKGISVQTLRAIWKRFTSGEPMPGLPPGRGWPLDWVNWYLNCALEPMAGIAGRVTVGDIVAEYVGCAEPDKVDQSDPRVRRAIATAVHSVRYFTGSAVEMANANLRLGISGLGLCGAAHLWDMKEPMPLRCPDESRVMHPEDCGMISAFIKHEIPFMAVIPMKTFIDPRRTTGDNFIQAVNRINRNAYTIFLAELVSSADVRSLPGRLSQHPESHWNSMCLVIKPKLRWESIAPARAPAAHDATNPPVRRKPKRKYSEFRQDQQH